MSTIFLRYLDKSNMTEMVNACIMHVTAQLFWAIKCFRSDLKFKANPFHYFDGSLFVLKFEFHFCEPPLKTWPQMQSQFAYINRFYAVYHENWLCDC